MREEIHLGTCVIAASWMSRLKGLLGTDADAWPMVLLRCKSIHTFGMRYDLDVALIDGKGIVVTSRRNVGSGRCISNKKAVMVLERPACDAPWVDEGAQLSFDWVGGKRDGSYVEVWVVGEGEGYWFRQWRQGDSGRFIPVC